MYDELCESSSAYGHNFEIYTAVANINNKPVDVCNHLLVPLSIRVTGCTPTTTDFTKQKNETSHCHQAGMVAVKVKWQDKRKVTLLSRFHDQHRLLLFRH